MSGLTEMWVEFALRSLAHQKEKLPPGAPPTVVIHTGNELHVWWAFKEPWIFETPDDRARAEAMVARWQTTLSQIAAIRG